MVWLDFRAPHRHLFVDVTVTSARTNTNIPHIGARLPLPGSLALRAKHDKLYADLRTSALLGTPSVQSVHDLYAFDLEDGGRLAPMAPMAAGLADRLAILVAPRYFHGMGAANYRSLRYDNYVRMQHFVRRPTYDLFRRFGGKVRREFMQCLFSSLHGTLGSYLRDSLLEINDDVVACLHVPRA
jgi:hypothetical protein